MRVVRALPRALLGSTFGRFPVLCSLAGRQTLKFCCMKEGPENRKNEAKIAPHSVLPLEALHDVLVKFLARPLCRNMSGLFVV